MLTLAGLAGTVLSWASWDSAGLVGGAPNPYVYPDNLPRVNAHGGPGGAPGCWQPITRELWPAPRSGDGHRRQTRAVQPHRDRLTVRNRVRLGPPSRGQHDQPMKITGTAIKLGIVCAVLVLFTVLIIVVFGQMRFDRTNSYSAEFSNASGLRNGQFVRASGVEIGKVKKVTLVDGGTAGSGGLQRRSLVAAVSVDDRADPLSQPGRRPLPGAQTRRGRGCRPGPAAGRIHPAVAHASRRWISTH